MHLFGHRSALTYNGCKRRQGNAVKVGNEVDAGSKPYWCGGTVRGLMRCRSERGPLLESIGSQLAGCAQKKGTTVSAASLWFSQDTRCTGPVCICFASLGTALSLIVSFAQVTWCALTVKPFVIAVVRISESREIPTTKVFVSIFYLCLSETCKDI